jgi:RHH-type rel operon transcriptional repressor/antitoxin RelB
MDGEPKETAMGARSARSLTLSAEQAERLENLARATNRSPEDMLGEAIDGYLDLQRWQIEHIRQGLDEIERGEGVPHDQVEAWLASWGTGEDRDPPL